MRFASEVEWRVSRRGLVIAAPGGDTVLLEHPRAAALPDLLADDPGAADLAGRLGEPNGVALVAELSEAGILRDAASRHVAPPPAPRVAVTRSGIEIAGIDRPAQWCARRLLPLLSAWPVRGLLVVVVAAGVWSLLAGRPEGPQVTAHPALDGLLGFGIGLLCSAAHEFAHAVALSHYGRRSRRAGFGFYWGAIAFYVDSTEALTLPRRARVTQALVGLAVDVVTVSLLAITAQLSTPVLLTAVAWRLAIVGLLNITVNAAPVLQVDGHWALADLLDEPDLGPRSRAALGTALRGRRTGAAWLALYGACSVACGFAVLVVFGLGYWYAAHDLLVALFSGDVAEIVVGALLVAPVAAGLLFSTLGLVLEPIRSAASAAERVPSQVGR